MSSDTTKADECQNGHRPYLLGRNPETGQCVLYRPDCKQWTCPYCGVVRAKQWAHRVRCVVRGEVETDTEKTRFWFLTLTSHERLYSLEYQIKAFRHAWDMLLKRIRRVVKRALTFVCVPELAPETGRFHIHAFFDWSFNAAYERKDKDKGWYSLWLHENPRQVGLGYEYNLKPVSSANGAAYYITKYLTKTLSLDLPKGFRRVRTSQHFPDTETDESDNEYLWEVVPCNSNGRRILLTALLAGEVISDLEHQRPVTLKHPLIGL